MIESSNTWAYRPLFLALFLAIVGWTLYLVLDAKLVAQDSPQMQLALTMFIVVASTSFAFSIERTRSQWVVLFSLAWGLVIALVSYYSFAPYTGRFNIDFTVWSGLCAASIALPLFQTVRLHGRATLPYQDLHEHAWSDVMCWCASWVFVGISFAVAYLLSALFQLIGIELLKDLLKEKWFVYLAIGASFGAALGVLKENEKIVASLQNLVMTILSLLAPVLCASLMLFLVAIPITGLQPLWNSTSSTTPVVLACAVGAITLINAIIRNSESEESKHTLLRYSAMGLSVCILPLAIIAGLSMQQRIQQYGLTPDRIWGMLVVLVGAAYGVAYLLGLIHSRATWASNLRTNNTRMAVLLCVTALALALPIVSFTELSVNSQLKRINDERIAPENIDFAAFAFNLGKPGRDVLHDWENSQDLTLANSARQALSANNKWRLEQQIKESNSFRLLATKLVVFPEAVVVPDELQLALKKQSACLDEYCLLIWKLGTDTAKLFTPDCRPYYHSTLDSDTKTNGYQSCPPRVTDFTFKKGKWTVDLGYTSKKVVSEQLDTDKRNVSKAINNGEIEIRAVERKQVFIGGKPVGNAY